jgi:hypothetical protein
MWNPNTPIDYGNLSESAKAQIGTLPMTPEGRKELGQILAKENMIVPGSRTLTMLSPNIWAYTGILPSGKQVIIGGFRDLRASKTTDLETSNQSGIAQMATGIDTIAQLQAGVPMEGLTGRFRAWAEQWLMKGGLPAIGAGGPALMAQKAMFSHAILPVMTFARGNRSTDKLRDQLYSIISSFTDDPRLQKAVTDTSAVVFNTMIKDVVERARLTGKTIDPQLMAIYNERGLSKGNLATMTQNAEREIAKLPEDMRTQAYGGTMKVTRTREMQIQDMQRDFPNVSRDQLEQDLRDLPDE